MDKRQFIEAAPLYYALAIRQVVVKARKGSVTADEIRNQFCDPIDGDPEDLHSYLEYDAIFIQAISWLAEHGLINVEIYDFGPTTYSDADDDYPGLFSDLKGSIDLFRKYDSLSDKEKWLKAALNEVNQAYEKLDIQPKDFQNPNRDWETLPLEKEEAHFQGMFKKLNEAIEAIRSDNEYAPPEERDYVLGNLRNASEKLTKSQVISVGFIREAVLSNLEIAMRRLKDGLTSVIVQAAKAAATEYLAYLRKTYLGF